MPARWSGCCWPRRWPSLANWAIYRWLLTPLVDRARTRGQLEVDGILATFGLLFIVQGVALLLFGGQYYSYGYLSVPVSVLGTTLALNRLLALAFAALVGTGLYLGPDAHAHRHGDPRRRRRSERRPAGRPSTCARRRRSPSRSAARWWRRAACWSACSSPSTPPWASSSR